MVPHDIESHYVWHAYDNLGASYGVRAKLQGAEIAWYRNVLLRCDLWRFILGEIRVLAKLMEVYRSPTTVRGKIGERYSLFNKYHVVTLP